jgi:DNA-binding NarL/FixJ family response regulator
LLPVLRILIADDHDVLRQGLRDLLEEKGWKVCGEAADGREAVGMALLLKPDVVVLDLDMPMLSGLEAARQIRGNKVASTIVIFTMHKNEYLEQAALEAGADAVVTKADGGNQLLDTIDQASHHPTTSPVARKANALTTRQVEILRLLAAGKSNRDISTALGISPKTVETHRAAIMRKLDINSITQLVRYAIRNKLVVP